MAGLGLVEPSRESSESEAPPDAWDPEAHCPRDLELEAPLVLACLEPDCKAKSREAQSKSNSKCKRKHTTTFILQNNAQHKQNHTNANSRHARETSWVQFLPMYVNQANGSTSIFYQVFKQILLFKNAAKIKQNITEANRIQCMAVKHILGIICQVQLSLNRASPGLAENQNASMTVIQAKFRIRNAKSIGLIGMPHSARKGKLEIQLKNYMANIAYRQKSGRQYTGLIMYKQTCPWHIASSRKS